MDQKQALVERLRQANNILVTVANNPSVDQLSSCIGLTLALNKMNKHATAVFSGAVPDTIEFLQPEKTIEKNTDSLRDFIIALDKSKADKLRYKVEDTVVKIFITPYRTSITDKDLEFSQGDFNVDAVVAIGVHNQGDLDQAITAHGRILHDATVTTINVTADGQIGAINWVDTRASSLSELVAEAVTELGKDILDEQMATALLTGIVAETQRFSNDKTTPTTMTISAELMAAGANQQLVATKLEPPKPVQPQPAPMPPMPENNGPQDIPQQLSQPLPPVEPPKPDDGTLEIAHDPAERLEGLENASGDARQPAPVEDQPAEQKNEDIAQIHIDDQGSLHFGDNAVQQPEEPRHEANTDPTKHMSQHMIMEPPSMGGGVNMDDIASAGEERPAGDPLGIAPVPTGILERSEPFAAKANNQPLTLSDPAPSPFATEPGNASAYPSPFSPTAAVAPDTAPGAVMAPPPLVVTPTVPQPTPITPAPAVPGQTLSEIEHNINSPHTQQYEAPFAAVPGQPAAPAVDANSARDAAMQAIATQPGAPVPTQALNALPLGDPLRTGDQQPSSPQGPMVPPAGPPPMMPSAQ